MKRTREFIESFHRSKEKLESPETVSWLLPHVVADNELSVTFPAVCFAAYRSESLNFLKTIPGVYFANFFHVRVAKQDPAAALVEFPEPFA